MARKKNKNKNKPKAEIWIPKFPNYAEYCSTFYDHQTFSLPDSIIYYITKNPNSPKAYKKLIAACKYFFIKNPLLLIHCLKYVTENDKNCWKTCSNNDKCVQYAHDSNLKTIDLNKTFISKIWNTGQLQILTSAESFFISSFIPKIEKPPSTTLELRDLPVNEFKFLTSDIRNFLVKNTIIRFESGEEMLLEKIIQNIPNLEWFNYEDAENSKSISSKTAKELCKVLPLKNIRLLRLSNVRENFDIDTFFNDIVKKSKISCCLYYNASISIEYQKKLQKIVDEILGETNHSFNPPYIKFPLLSRSISLHSLFLKFFW